VSVCVLFRSALDVIEDNCPHALPQDVIPAESALLTLKSSGSDSSVGDKRSNRRSNVEVISQDQVDQQSNDNIKAVESRAKAAESALLVEQEKSAAVIAKYRCHSFYIVSALP
jgi:hypothetical protein